MSGYDLPGYDTWLERPYDEIDFFDGDEYEPDPDRYHDDPDYWRPSEAEARAYEQAYLEGLAEHALLMEELAMA